MRLIHFVQDFNLVIGVTITLLYLYQVGYLVVGLFRRRWRDKYQPKALHRYAVLISARNEEGAFFTAWGVEAPSRKSTVTWQAVAIFTSRSDFGSCFPLSYP